jgi:hypothetical protein
MKINIFQNVFNSANSASSFGHSLYDLFYPQINSLVAFVGIFTVLTRKYFIKYFSWITRQLSIGQNLFELYSTFTGSDDYDVIVRTVNPNINSKKVIYNGYIILKRLLVTNNSRSLTFRSNNYDDKKKIKGSVFESRLKKSLSPLFESNSFGPIFDQEAKTRFDNFFEIQNMGWVFTNTINPQTAYAIFMSLGAISGAVYTYEVNKELVLLYFETLSKSSPYKDALSVVEARQFAYCISSLASNIELQQSLLFDMNVIIDSCENSSYGKVTKEQLLIVSLELIKFIEV